MTSVLQLLSCTVALNKVSQPPTQVSQTPQTLQQVNFHAGKVKRLPHPLTAPWPRIEKGHDPEGSVYGLCDSRAQYVAGKHAWLVLLFKIDKVLHSRVQSMPDSIGNPPFQKEGVLVEQRRRELIGDLTHELRTPLTIVEGYLEGLSDGTIDPSIDIYDHRRSASNPLG